MPRHTVYLQTVVQALTAEGDQERNVAVYINGGQEERLIGDMQVTPPTISDTCLRPPRHMPPY